jgi:hypothetical protein
MKGKLHGCQGDLIPEGESARLVPRTTGKPYCLVLRQAFDKCWSRQVLSSKSHHEVGGHRVP